MATQLVSKPRENELPDLTSIQTKKKAPEREYWLYFLTASACVTVVWGHVAAQVFLNASTPFQWWVGNITDSAARWCVTLFIMVSGYLLLNPSKEYTIMEFYKKRASRIIIPFVFWALFFAVVNTLRHVFNGDPVSFSSFIKPVLNGHPNYHLWYLYMLVGLYVLTPFLRAGLKKIPPRWLPGICAALFIIPAAVNTYSWFALKADFISDYPFIVWPLYLLGYYLAGYLIGKKAKIETKTITLVTAFLASTAVTAFGCYILKENISDFAGIYFYSPAALNVVFTTLVFFMLGKKLAANIRNNKILETGNAVSFGIYLIHPFWIFTLDYFGFGATKMNPIIGIIIVGLAVFILSLATTLLIQKIPHLRKVV